MATMKLPTPHLIAFSILVLGCGLVHGLWSGRWAATKEIEIAHLLEFDEPIGDWHPGEYVQVDPKELPKGQATITRRFVNKKKNRSIVLSLSAGHPGIVSVHTPDVCYLGTGYTLKGAVKRESTKLPEAGTIDCYTADFQKQGTSGNESIRVRWSWSSDGVWKAPDSPRFHFVRAGVLYKLYLVHPLSDDEDLTKDDPYRKFVAELAPLLSRKIN